MRGNPGRAAKTVALPLLALVFAALMLWDALLHPPDPSLIGTRAYGHNGPGAFGEALQYLIPELLVALLVLRPWSYRASWGRALIAAIIGVPWTMLIAVAGMHAGSVFLIHLLWLIILDVVFLVSLLWSLFAAARGARAPEAGAP